MTLLFDSFWRAVAYCLHPRVLLLSLLPLMLLAVLSLGLGYVYWDAALDVVRQWLQASAMVDSMASWLAAFGMGKLDVVLAPLIVIFAVTPLIVVVSLLAVALLMTPALTAWVAEKRFPALVRLKGGSFWGSLGWSLLSTLLALVAMLVSLPLWLIPPLILIIPPLIWGWLTYRVMAFDALAEHASQAERREIFRRHRFSLLGIGVFCGYLGAAPGLIWASGALLAAAFVVLVPLAIWIYAWVFALSSLWFAHFCLAALQQLRLEHAPASASAMEVIDLDSSPSAPPHEPLKLPNSH